MKKLTLSDIKIKVIATFDNDANPYDCLSECCTVEEIKEILEDSCWNVWKWCSIEIKGTYKSLEASDYLGACSYQSEEEFKLDGYYEQMCEEVLEDLQAQVEEIAKDFCDC